MHLMGVHAFREDALTTIGSWSLRTDHLGLHLVLKCVIAYK